MTKIEKSKFYKRSKTALAAGRGRWEAVTPQGILALTKKLQSGLRDYGKPILQHFL
ncbi:MAG: hypothetical protein Q4F57_00615 [Weeksellaceae bacterium]|nr:hypothetical protein [Weeksellaceae bacterium]